MNREVLGRYVRHYQGSRGRLAAGVGLSLLQTATLIPIPLLVREAIDVAIPQADIRRLVVIGLVILGLTVIGALLSLGSGYITASVVRDAVKRLRRDAVEKLFLVSRSFVTSKEPSVLHDQIVQESGRVNRGTMAVLDTYIPGVVLVLGIGSVLVSMNPLLAMITLGFGPAIVIAGRLLGRRVRTRVRRQHETFERFSHGVLRILRANDLIRIHGAEDIEMEEIGRRATDLESAGVARSVWSKAYSQTQSTLLALAGAAVLIVGGIFVARGSMSFGDLISFYAGFALLRGPLAGIALRVPIVIEGLTSLSHLDELLVEPDLRPYNGTRQVDSTGHVRLVDVSFGYGPEPVIQDVSLQLERGKITAIAGPNGSGKSTLASLILGFYRPDRGELLAEGVPYPEVDLISLRRTFGVVPQHTVLLNGTVGENVAFGRPDVDDATLRWAVDVAEADFIWRLKDGLDTEIGDEGVFLSGGQRQRLAIARAIIHRPALLILDEPTNHLDRESMSSIMHRIAHLELRPAVLLISHRPEVLGDVDEIVELKEGRVISVRPGG